MNSAKKAKSKSAKKKKGSTAPLASNSQSGAAPVSPMVAIVVSAFAAGLAVAAIAKSTTQKTTGHSESEPMLGIVTRGKLPSSTLT